MKLIKSIVPQRAFLIQNNIHFDDRGFFSEIYRKNFYKNDFSQVNLSESKKKFTFRGLHFQKKPYGQAKLIYVLKGKILDIFVDIKKNSETFGKYFSVNIIENSSSCLYIDEDFAHGFLTLEKNTKVMYFVSKYWNQKNEVSINPFDQELNIKWEYNIKKFILSDKDSNKCIDFNKIR